jgi:hypothetical protein
MDSLDLTKKTFGAVTAHHDAGETSPVRTVKREHGELLFYAIQGELPAIPAFEHILKLYSLKREGAVMPCRKAFTFRDMRGWHSSFFLIDFESDLSDGRVSILGEMYRTLFSGILRQNMRVSEMKSEALEGVSGYFRDLLTGPYVGRYRGNVPHAGREHVAVDILDLPVLDEKGDPRYLMSFVRETPKRTSILRGVAVGQ